MTDARQVMSRMRVASRSHFGSSHFGSRLEEFSLCVVLVPFFASLKHQCAWVVADGSPSTLQQGGCRSSEDPAHHQCSGHELDSSPVSLFSTVHVSHQRTHKSLADGVRSGPGSIPRR